MVAGIPETRTLNRHGTPTSAPAETPAPKPQQPLSPTPASTNPMHSLTTLRARLNTTTTEDDGFTLIELMVVVLIIAILIGIAIPTFLGVRRSAQDRAAQSTLRNALTNAKAIYADSQDYASATPAALNNAETSIAFVDAITSSTGAKTVSTGSTSGEVFLAVARSESGTCFAIADNLAGAPVGVSYAALTLNNCASALAALQAASFTDEW